MEDGQHLVDRRTAILSGGGLLAALLAACGPSSGGSSPGAGPGAVDLTFSEQGRLTGTLDGRAVDVTSALPAGSGTADGAVAGKPVHGGWVIARNNTDNPSTLPVSLDGTFAGQPLTLSATFQLTPRFLLASGTIAGTAGGRPVHAQVRPAVGESSSTVQVDGSFAGTAFSLYGTIAGDLSGGLVRGTVHSKPVHLQARLRAGVIRLSGDYEGPPALFVLTAGSLVYFLGGIYA